MSSAQSKQNIALQKPGRWQEYELLDSGNLMKLERFGQHILIRPEPQALWAPAATMESWEKKAHARFDQQGSHSGSWKRLFADMPDRWNVQYHGPGYNLKLRLALTGFKHVGVFPEQAANWDYIFESCKAIQGQPKVLNLFAYTGGATLAAAAAGADVTHVDAIKQVVTWANDNLQLNMMKGVRWLVEDALTFLKKEQRRGNRYQGIIMDPPAFGHGPKGERWKLEEMAAELTATACSLLEGRGSFLVFNAYSLGYSSLIPENLIRTSLKNIGDLETGELYLHERARSLRMPAGVYVRAKL